MFESVLLVSFNLTKPYYFIDISTSGQATTGRLKLPLPTLTANPRGSQASPVQVVVTRSREEPDLSLTLSVLSNNLLRFIIGPVKNLKQAAMHRRQNR